MPDGANPNDGIRADANRNDARRDHAIPNDAKPDNPKCESPHVSPAPWPHHGSTRGPDLRLFQVRHDRLTNPRTGVELERLVLETPDWVNVVALSAEDRVVLVRQYRFGIGRVTTEIPGGVIDRGESHRAAAERELREETGYTSDRWIYLGSVEANPAFQTNLCHHWLAREARRTHEPEPDSGEDITVHEASFDDVRAAIDCGEIAHALVISALARVMDLRAR